MITFKIALNDAGLSKSKRPKQKNSCTVIATAVAFNMSYDDAFDIMQIHGRQNNKGYPFEWFLKQYPQHCSRISIDKYRTLESIYPELQDGKYIVMIPYHTFAVVNGVIHDRVPVNCYSEVYSLYKVHKDMHYVDTLFDAL